jgi:aspartate racemase
LEPDPGAGPRGDKRTMIKKVIGILGGMGPEATLDCYGKIIKNTPAAQDQDHLRVVIDSNPEVPDRTEAILGKGDSPVPALVRGSKVLEYAGADFIIIPCVSVHFFLDELRSEIDLPILSIFDAVAETIEREHPEIKTVGLLGTTGTVRGGGFQKRLGRGGIKTVVCDEHHQARVMAAIYDIKKTESDRSRKAIIFELTAAAESLIAQGAQGVVAGCTEIPLALTQEHLSVPYFDAVLILAREAISKCGLEPLPLR